MKWDVYYAQQAIESKIDAMEQKIMQGPQRLEAQIKALGGIDELYAQGDAWVAQAQGTFEIGDTLQAAVEALHHKILGN